jgi:hypothetical protein
MRSSLSRLSKCCLSPLLNSVYVKNQTDQKDC